MKLTLPQNDLYFEQQLYPNDPIYNIGAKIKIEGPLIVDNLKKAYSVLIDQHDAFRTILLIKQGDVSCEIIENHGTELGFLDYSNCQDPEYEASEFMQSEFVQPFDLSNRTLLHKFILIKLAEEKYYLFSVYHHIITDGWGTSIMFQRLVENYNQICSSGIVFSKYPFTYADFALDDQAYQLSQTYLEDKQYWIQRFQSLPERLFKKISQSTPVNRSDRKVFKIKRKKYNQLVKKAKSLNGSIFHLILSAIYLYFGKKHQNYDFVIGLPVLNRSKAIFKKTVGLFMGVSPLRISVDLENTLEQLIYEIKNQLRIDYRHQRFPIGQIIQGLPALRKNENLFDITFSYEKQNYSDDFTETKTTVTPLTHNSERVALAIYIREFDENEDVTVDFDYNVNYFHDDSISSVVTQFEALLDNLAKVDKEKLKEVSYMQKSERTKLLLDFNRTAVEYPKHKTILNLLDEQVTKFPHKKALFDVETSYSYLELDRLSNKIAECILIHDGNDHNPIGVLLDRSADTILFLLGILKAGKSFIPLDPLFPSDRLRYILDDSGINTLISNQSDDLGLDSNRITTLSSDKILKDCKDLKGNLQNVKSNNTAYIIYTSGSTGYPKGVEIGHRSLLNFVLSMSEKPGVKATDCLYAVTTCSFDISILEFFTPLVAGGCVFVADHAILQDPLKLIESINEIKPSIIQATPSFFQMLFDAGWEGRYDLTVLCGGDRLSENLAAMLLDTCANVWNMYGPTESTIWSSIKHIKFPDEASNIGKPIANTQFYILDKYLQPLPINAVGDLYISGDGLARGYYKQEALTQEKFITNIFQGNGKMYHTGDLAMWNNLGEVEFIGRSDNQVKVRGYRVELGEIETIIGQIKQIRQVAVILKNTKDQDPIIVAYIVKKNEDLEEGYIDRVLSSKLPYYMIPSLIIALEKFPLTPNQKIDRKALANKPVRLSVEKDSIKPPVSKLERQLVEYFVQVLNLDDQIGIGDNFFTLGGHSLSATRLIRLIHDNLNVLISLKSIFDFPTVDLLAKHISNIEVSFNDHIPSAKNNKKYELTNLQHKIWLASQTRELSIAYNMAAAFRVDQKLDIEKIEYTINQMLEAHEILRTNFVETEGTVYQKIAPIESINFKVSSCEIEERLLDQTLKMYINQEFDLQDDLLIRMKIVNCDSTSSVLVFCTHHSILDGWSLELFTEQFIRIYTSLSSNALHSNKLENNRIRQFRDYAEWLAKGNFDQDPNFWEDYLNGYKTKESFKPDYYIENENHKRAQYEARLDTKHTAALIDLAKKCKTTIHNVLATSLNVLIYKYSDHDDICLATINYGRNNPELYDTLGMFAKTLPLRTKISENQTFVEVLLELQRNMLEINHQQDVPTQIENNLKYDLMMVYQNPDFTFQGSLSNERFEFEPLSIDIEHCKFPLLFEFYEKNNELHLLIIYNSGLYDESSVQIISSKLKEVLFESIKNPSVCINQMDISLEVEKQDLVDIKLNF